MLKKSIGLTLFSLLILHNSSKIAEASSNASAAARITATVMKSISIEKVTDLDFGSAYEGSQSETINATNSNAANFLVQGEPGKAFSVVLPEKVELHPANNTTKDSISVSQFTSLPSQTGRMDKNGKTSLKVGATRSPISKNQEKGEYAGQFTITVTYQ